MKKLLLLFALFSLISCEEIHYDGETRLVFQTTVKKADGTPLPYSYVEIIVTDNYNTDIISKGKTDSNGKITLVFPAPENLDINLRIYNDDQSFMEKKVMAIKKTDFTDYKFIYDNAYLLKMDETAPLNVTYNQTNSNNVLEKVSIAGIYYAYPDYYNFFNSDYNFPYQFLIKKNQAFQLKYTVTNLQSHIQTDHVVDLQIANDPINYTLNY